MYLSLLYFVSGFSLLLLTACDQPSAIKATQSVTSQTRAAVADPFKSTNAKPEPIKKLPQLPKLLDDARPGSDFYRFREQLRQAIRRRDANFIRQHSIPNIQLSFSDKKETWDKYDINNPNSRIWRELERTFDNGCHGGFQGENSERFECPYIVEFIVQHNLDIDYVGVIGNQIPFYAKPNAKNSQISVLSNQIAKLDEENSGSQILANSDRWVGIVLANGQHGYVNSQYLYSIIGYRSLLVKDSDTWKIGLFIAGD
jgi:hypothetical protein